MKRKSFEVYIYNNGDSSVGISSTCHTIKLDGWFGNMLKDEELLNSFKEDLCELFTKYDEEFGYSATDEDEEREVASWETAVDLDCKQLEERINELSGKTEKTLQEESDLKIFTEELKHRG